MSITSCESVQLTYVVLSEVGPLCADGKSNIDAVVYDQGNIMLACETM